MAFSFSSRLCHRMYADSAVDAGADAILMMRSMRNETERKMKSAVNDDNGFDKLCRIM